MGTTTEATPRVAAETEWVEPELDLGLPPRNRARKRGSGRSTLMQAVVKFHLSFQLPVATKPQSRVPKDLSLLRIELLREEFEEFCDAVSREDIVAIADALGDIVYVAYGSAVTYGIDLDAVVREIHRANMSKLGLNGQPEIREDGKVLRGPGYRPPDIRGILIEQPALVFE